MSDSPKTVLALDIGTVRIGVAQANTLSRLPQPLTTLTVDNDILTVLEHLIRDQQASALVVGVPRGLDGQDTDQTRLTLDFIAKLRALSTVPVYLQDEAVTSVKAETELMTRGKQFTKADVDALAAVYILEDFLNDHRQNI
jgi:putative Holliday junction resolvase